MDNLFFFKKNFLKNNIGQRPFLMQLGYLNVKCLLLSVTYQILQNDLSYTCEFLSHDIMLIAGVNKIS